MSGLSISCCQTGETPAPPIVLWAKHCDHETLAAIVDHHGPTLFLPQSHRRLQREGKLSDSTKHRTCKYLNAIIEADHGALKRVVRPTRLSNYEGGGRYHQELRDYADGPPRPLPHRQAADKDEVRLVNKLFDVFAIAA